MIDNLEFIAQAESLLGSDIKSNRNRTVMSRPARSLEPDSSTKLAELEALQAVIEGLTTVLHSLDKTGHSVASIHLNSAIEVLRADEIRMANKLGLEN